MYFAISSRYLVFIKMKTSSVKDPVARGEGSVDNTVQARAGVEIFSAGSH